MDTIGSHEKYMLRCLDLAQKGLGMTYPNPLVGCIIVYKGKIIAEAYHQRAGESHAEVLALKQIKDPSILDKSTLYVNLEPCSHFGKTPPCAPLIVNTGIKRVVIAHRDPNPKVNGNGVEILKNAGIEVLEGICEKEARFVNRRFLVNQTVGRPYIILKWAQSADGFIDIDRTKTKLKGSYPISGKYSPFLTHRWRREEQAIYAGFNTMLNDDPQLTVRKVGGNQPVAIIEDRDLTLPGDLRLFSQNRKIVIVNEKIDKQQDNVRFLKVESIHDAEGVMRSLYRLGICSVMIEGGRKTLEKFLRQNLYDEIRVIQSKKIIGEGLPAPEVHVGYQHIYQFMDDEIKLYYRTFN